MIEIPVLSVCGPLGVGNDLSVSEVGLLATVVEVCIGRYAFTTDYLTHWCTVYV